MSIINNILEIAVKKNINALDANNYGDTALNTLANNVNTALSTVDRSEDVQDKGYNIRLPGPSQLIASPTGCVLVCASNYCSANGNCCLWTVPAGATTATFQIWGAGGNASGCCHGACCAVGYFGGSGEYKFVKMRVTPGQTYTLCAGGAALTGSCYSYQEQSGCNSFVCGSNNTCMLSCGGFMSSCNSSCINYYDPQYPGYIEGCYVWSGEFYRDWFYNYTMCNGNMQKVGTRFCGMCQGGVTTSNSIISIGQAPSMVGTWLRCTTTNYAYMYACSAPIVNCNNEVCRVNVGTGSGYWGGCEMDSSSCYNTPGHGGPPTSWACYSSGPVYGGRGRSGQVLVKFC